MSSFHLNIGPDGVTYHGPDGWTRVGPGSWTPETIAAAANSKKNTSSADESATKNKNKQSKRYYCCYGHGYNNTHNSQQCNKRKKIADNPTHPANPIQKMFRQEVARLAKKEFDAVKAKDIKKENDSYAEKSNGNVLARYSNAELKEKFEEFKKEMERRGIR